MKLPLQIPSAVTTSTMDARLMQCDEPVTMHTLAAYGTALSLGADWIEPDVVASSDRDLWVLHTVDLNVTTSVHEVFGSSKEPWHSPRAQPAGEPNRLLELQLYVRGAHAVDYLCTSDCQRGGLPCMAGCGRFQDWSRYCKF